MSKQKLKDIKLTISKLNPLIEVLNNDYKGTRSTIICRCKKHNLVWESNIANLSRNSECSECKSDRRISEIKETLSVISPNIEILTDTYEGAKTKMPLLCTVCEHEWSANWNNLLSGKGCPKCKNRLKLSISEIKTRLLDINPSIEILSKKYINNYTKLDCKCHECGHLWSASWATLGKGIGCPSCAGNAKYTLDQLKKLFKDSNLNIEIVSKNYKNSNEKMDFKCLVCGCEWSTSVSSIINGHTGCPDCAIKRVSGENNWNWKGGISEIKNYLRGSITQWKKDSMRKGNYKCIITGEDFEEIHHAYNFSSIVYEAFDICNISFKPYVIDYTEKELLQLSIVCSYLHYEYGLGKLLTKKLHAEYHSIYGRKNNTVEQFEEFVEFKKRERELTHGNL